MNQMSLCLNKSDVSISSWIKCLNKPTLHDVPMNQNCICLAYLVQMLRCSWMSLKIIPLWGDVLTHMVLLSCGDSVAVMCVCACVCWVRGVGPCIYSHLMLLQWELDVIHGHTVLVPPIWWLAHVIIRWLWGWWGAWLICLARPATQQGKLQLLC